MNNPAKYSDSATPNLAATRAQDEGVKRVVASNFTTSEKLFAGARELVIAHAGEEYRLRLTNQGKLILTK
jgi:hemin uptake protein HemP